MAKAELEGEKFGRLTVIKEVEKKKKWKVRWECLCECGETTFVISASLVSGNTKSCGCLGRERSIESATIHGMSYAPEHGVWSRMKNRCSRKKDPKYKDYGGRGISICNRWNSFVNFYADMGRRPSAKHSIDRINNNGNYEPSNCRWATQSEQARNKRNMRASLIIDPEGEEILIAKGAVTEFCRDIGLRPESIHRVLHGGRRHYKGWTGRYLEVSCG